MEKLVLCYRLKELRTKNHYTQEYVSSQLNIGRATYSNYELGKRMPSLDIVVDFAKFYHVTLTYLLFPVEGEQETMTAATQENPANPATEDEIHLLSMYRTLSKPMKREVIDFAAFIKSRR